MNTYIPCTGIIHVCVQLLYKQREETRDPFSFRSAPAHRPISVGRKIVEPRTRRYRTIEIMLKIGIPYNVVEKAAGEGRVFGRTEQSYFICMHTDSIARGFPSGIRVDASLYAQKKKAHCASRPLLFFESIFLPGVKAAGTLRFPPVSSAAVSTAGTEVSALSSHTPGLSFLPKRKM